MPVIEAWLPVVGLPHYLVSNLGRVRHAERREARTIQVNERGIPVVLLSSRTSSSRYLRQINQLVAQAFLPEPEHADESSVWHLDGDQMNCEAANLRWDTRARVLEWNEMHRRGTPKYPSPAVRNNETGNTYTNAYECAMKEGVLETTILWYVERQAAHMEDDSSKYRYVFS